MSLIGHRQWQTIVINLINPTTSIVRMVSVGEIVKKYPNSTNEKPTQLVLSGLGGSRHVDGWGTHKLHPRENYWGFVTEKRKKKKGRKSKPKKKRTPFFLFLSLFFHCLCFCLVQYCILFGQYMKKENQKHKLPVQSIHYICRPLASVSLCRNKKAFLSSLCSQKNHRRCLDQVRGLMSAREGFGTVKDTNPWEVRSFKKSSGPLFPLLPLLFLSSACISFH